MENRKAFTLIEILVIVAIIAILATIILGLWVISARNKAAVVSYKSSMKSVQTAIELCTGTGGAVASGSPGDAICGGNEIYPTIDPKCGGGTPTFTIIPSPATNVNPWLITTTSGGSSWDCRGCRIACTVTECTEIESSPGDCF